MQVMQFYNETVKFSLAYWIVSWTRLLMVIRSKQILVRFYSRLTPWNWALLKKLPVAQLLNNFPTFHGTRRFIAVFTRGLYWSLSWATWIHPIPADPFYLRSILILSSHIRLCLSSGLLPSDCPTKILYVFHSTSIVLHALPISFSLSWSS
jgi:hypothetical protein